MSFVCELSQTNYYPAQKIEFEFTFVTHKNVDLDQICLSMGSDRSKLTKMVSVTRGKIDQIDATLFAEQRLNHVVIKFNNTC